MKEQISVVEKTFNSEYPKPWVLPRSPRTPIFITQKPILTNVKPFYVRKHF